MGTNWPFVFINKVLLKHSRAHHLYILYHCFYATIAKLSRLNRDYLGTQGQKYLLSGHLWEMFADPCSTAKFLEIKYWFHHLLVPLP